MNKYLKESLLIIFAVLPLIYLSIVWKSLPDIVPTHFNIDGVADNWSSKTTLIYLPGAMGFGIYLLMLIIPYIDPKKKIEQMGSKYYNLRFVLSFFMSVLTIYIIYISRIGNMKDSNLLFVIIGSLCALLGNYFQTVRPNYFVGIRTPWTLENEEIWKKTHRFGGKLWMLGGLLIVLLAFLIKNNVVFTKIFTALILLIAIIPIVYSYIEFQKEKKS
ncbi:MAG TPA: hypothetical protein DIW31_11955 [Bacteroidales bacterium]|nr:hypothetical protein [Bacteroidales bacterium]